MAWTPSDGTSPEPPATEFTAIWDTGADGCVITQRVVDACGLVATGMARAHGVNGAADVETYLVNLVLPNNVRFQAIPVTKGDFIGGDLLIGMNIIGMGDFAVTNHGGVTKFSFRVPSMAHIDFVEDFNNSQPLAGGNRAARRAAKKQ